MIILTIIALYTSRVVLENLGIDNYGVYNAVGGFVAMFSLISGALSNAISRFLTFELGKGDKVRLKEVFSTSITVQILLATVIVVLSEAIGIWFLNVKMNIPDESIKAANWVFQCSVLTFAINIISVPYNASIVAHEKMTVFAYISIFETLLKLGVAILLSLFFKDRLIIYAVFLLFVAIIIRLTYSLYCKKNFEECSYSFSYNRQLMKEITKLASWNMLGSASSILNSHGINLLMNLFFGVSANAARGLSVQVNSAVTHFVTSFTTAVKPQITKSYARGEKSYMFSLVNMSAKYSFFLMLCLSMPVLLETPLILKIWLKEVPDHTVLFVRLTLVAALISTLSTPLYTLAMAHGNIKKYQLVIGSLSLSNFVMTFILYEIGFAVEAAYYSYIFIQLCILYARVKIVSGLTGLDTAVFFRQVVGKSFIVTVIVSVCSIVILRLIHNDTVLNGIVVVAFCLLITFISIWFIGFKMNERKQIKSIVIKFLNKYDKRSIN